MKHRENALELDRLMGLVHHLEPPVILDQFITESLSVYVIEGLVGVVLSQSFDEERVVTNPPSPLDTSSARSIRDAS